METPINMPARPGNREISWILDSAVSRSTSPFSMTEQVYAWPGQRWSVVIKLPSMRPEDGEAWQAFFGDLNGMEGSFFVPQSAFLRAPGLDYGAPEVEGAESMGAKVQTRGWTPDTVQIVRKGQRIEIAGRMRQVIETADSDASGRAVLRIWPHARDLTDGLPIIWQNPRGVFRASSIPEFTWDKARLMSGFQFSASEVILP